MSPLLVFAHDNTCREHRPIGVSRAIPKEGLDWLQNQIVSRALFAKLVRLKHGRFHGLILGHASVGTELMEFLKNPDSEIVRFGGTFEAVTLHYFSAFDNALVEVFRA